jgi:hypothetical protein
MPVGLALACAFGAGAFSRPVLNYLVGYPDAHQYLYGSRYFVPTLTFAIIASTTALYALIFTGARHFYRHHPSWAHWIYLLFIAYYATMAEPFRTIISSRPTDVWEPFPRLGFSFIAVIALPCFFLSVRSPLDGFFCSGMAALYAGHLRVMDNVGLDVLYFVTVPVSVVYLFLTGKGPVRAIASLLPFLIVTTLTWGVEIWGMTRWDLGAILSSSVYAAAPLLGTGVRLSVRYLRRRRAELCSKP